MRDISISISIIILLFISITNVNAQPESKDLDVNKILKIADHSRGNMEGVVWDVNIESFEDNEIEEERKLNIQAKGYNFLATFQYPAKMKNNKVLMKDHNMWYTKPGLRKPVPVSPKQKMVGGASYGDLAATNYAKDYNATLIGEDDVNNESCFVFDLVANTDDATYDKIKYWVSKNRTVGLKAKYYSVSGKLLKEAYFEYDHVVGQDTNQQRPFISKMIIYDKLIERNKTHLIYSEPTITEIKDAIFNVNRLGLS